MKIIENHIQKDFDKYAEQQRIVIPEEEKKHSKQFPDLFGVDFGFMSTGILLSCLITFFLVASSNFVLRLNDAEQAFLIYSIMIFTTIFYPMVALRIKSKFFPIHGKKLENKIIHKFSNTLLSESLHNTLKLHFSMDEYKQFILKYSNPTYGNLRDFLQNRNILNEKLKNIENNKLTLLLNTEEIVSYHNIKER